RHTRFSRDWSSDVCSSDLYLDTANGDRIVTNRTGSIKVFSQAGDELQHLPNIPYGARILKQDKARVKRDERIVQWDPTSSPIVAEVEGTLLYEDIVENVTMRIDFDPETENRMMVITEHREERHPRLMIVSNTETDDDGNPKIIAHYSLSAGTIVARDAVHNKPVFLGQVLGR